MEIALEITCVNTNGGIVYVYENERLLFTKEGELIAYDRETVSINKDAIVYIYDTNGNLLAY